ncbi:Hypoxanthine-guanine phosphoribosyltransferase [Ananas comosus]|uniref:Hypoxanthine-guanine phosphoribosyltransferase n=1 Tax=Ananas comosus TaxID=4615 RepID=A0A199UDU1_ANACO|nr:Hypoxanthine-guanine phosphoribosyltransferase [Ananas comosus]
MGSEAEIERVLWTEEEIARRVAELGAAISADFKGAVPSPVVLVGVATGAFLFLADIAREITVPVAIDFVRAESYGAGTESSGEPRISGDLKIDVEGKHVEDIVDTGNTLSRLMSHLCPDYFVVGYGMDYAELYRNLPYVGILKPEMYK